MRIKYIMFDDIFPVIFHSGIPHNKIHAGFLHKHAKATSAGFVQILPCQLTRRNDAKIPANCYGESESLKLKSKGKIDSEIIERFLNEEN